MKLIHSNYEILEQGKGLDGINEQIELAGRTCYKSEDKITEDSAKDFVDRMIKSQHCYTGNTELLTDKGWIKFSNYNGEKVAAINKDCSFKGFEIPQRIISHSYNGNFYYYPALGIEVTDGHNMFGVFRNSKNNFYSNNEYTLFKCSNYYKDNNNKEKTLGERMFKTPRHCMKPVSTDPYGELVGFWLGDGCYSPETVNKLVFHLQKKRKIEYLKQLCKELNYVFEERKSNYFTVTNTNIGRSFSSLYYNNGKRISLQYFPSVNMAYSIIKGLINSDGSLGVNTKTITFTNISKSIIDWMLMYAPICGYSISYRGISHTSTSGNPVYKVLLLDTNYTINNDSRNKDSKVEITNKTEDVYCVTVSTGLILVRGTNGITTICGNCAMLEHGTVYLAIPRFDYKHIRKDVFGEFISDKYPDLIRIIEENKYSKVKIIEQKDNTVITFSEDDLKLRPCHLEYIFVTTNYRVIIENGLEELLQYICEPTKYHEKRITVKFTCDRGVSHEFVRHRVFSFAQESTRYCNYSKDKFGNELTFIVNDELHDDENATGCDYHNLLENIELTYLQIIKDGYTAQQARTILPNALKTELVMTGFASDWKGFFKLRDNSKAHPDARALAKPLHEEFIKKGYIDGNLD